MLRKLMLAIALYAPLFANAQSELARYQKKILANLPVKDASEADRYVKIAIEKDFDAVSYKGDSGAGDKRNLFNLTDKGQQAYIDGLNSKTADAKSFIEKLPSSLEISSVGATGFEVKKTEFLKRISLDVKDMNNPTQKGRIASLSIFLELENKDMVELIGFSNLSTKYQTTDFGTLSLTKVKSFTLNAGLELAGTGSASYTQEDTGEKSKTTGVLGGTTGNKSNLGVSYTYGRTLAEQVAIKNSIIAMRGSLGSSQAYILQNGVPNKNLDDRVDFELIFKVKNSYSQPALKFKGLFEAKPGDAPDAQVSINKIFFTLPQLSSAIKAKIRYTYVYREIVSGFNTAIEADDKIIYHNLEDPAISREIDVNFVKPEDVKPELYHIGFKTEGTGESHDLYLNYYGAHIKLLFDNYSQAEELISWLRYAQKSSIKGFSFEKRKEGTSIAYEKAVFSEKTLFDVEREIK